MKSRDEAYPLCEESDIKQDARAVLAELHVKQVLCPYSRIDRDCPRVILPSFPSICQSCRYRKQRLF